MTPLVFATARGGYTKFIHFLLKAGADPNIPDDVCFVFFSIYFADLVCNMSSIKASDDTTSSIIQLFLLFGELFWNEFRLLCVVDYANGKLHLCVV
jgi:hypothetical protein